MSRRACDRERTTFGSAKIFILLHVGQQPQQESYFAGDRVVVNPARPTRTGFYSARNMRAGIETSMTGDCEEVNPTATLLKPSNAGWYERFRQDGSL
jgi:hypothetical protein